MFSQNSLHASLFFSLKRGRTKSKAVTESVWPQVQVCINVLILYYWILIDIGVVYINRLARFNGWRANSLNEVLITATTDTQI